MEQSTAIVLFIFFVASLIGFFIFRNSRDICLQRAENGERLNVVMTDYRILANHYIRRMNFCTITLVLIGTYAFIAFINEEEAPRQLDLITNSNLTSLNAR